MPDTGAAPSVVSNQLPPRTTSSHRWPRKWATLGGRSTPASSMFPSNTDENEFHEKTNGHHVNGNGTANGSNHHHHRYSTSLFRKSSTISRTNGTTNPNSDLTNESPSLKKSRSLINVLRSKLNSPAVLRRFRTKSRENSKQTITEVDVEQKPTDEKVLSQSNNDDNNNPNNANTITNKKFRKRDPSPMKRFTSRLAQLTRSSTHTSIDTEQQKIQERKSPTPPPANHSKDEVDHINACYDEIRAKYFDTNNTNAKKTSVPLSTQNSYGPSISERFKDILSTTTTSSIEYYDRPNATNDDIHNRSLSTISMNGSLISHDFLNNSQQYVQTSSSPPKASDDPLLQARKQSNIKLNCMLSGYGFTTPFGNHEKVLGQGDLFKFHHYHDVGKTKFDFNFTSNNNRMYSSLRTRPMSRSIDSFRRATTTIENEIIPSDLPAKSNDHLLIADDNLSNVPCDNELVIREDGDIIEPEKKVYSSKVHVTPAASLSVKTFVSTSSSVIPDEETNLSNGKTYDDDFERNFLRAVDRALGVANKDDNLLLQPVYDLPTKVDNMDMTLAEITDLALSKFDNKNFPMDNEGKIEQVNDNNESHVDGTESPNVELFDRTGELFDTENVQWQSSAVYDEQSSNVNDDQQICNGHTEEDFSIDDNVWSLVDDLTRKTQEFLLNEPQVSSIDN